MNLATFPTLRTIATRTWDFALTVFVVVMLGGTFGFWLR